VPLLLHEVATCRSIIHGRGEACQTNPADFAKQYFSKLRPYDCTGIYEKRTPADAI